MKLLVVLCAVIACSYAASVSEYVKVANQVESMRAAGPQSRIANGHAALQAQFPWQCSMLAPTGGNFAVCGCTIISTTWALTAAHCAIPHDQFNLRFGAISLFLGGIAQTTFHSIIHPDYNPFTLNNDIALLSIPVPLTLTGQIQPVRLAALSQINAPLVNLQSTIAGWGATGPGSGVQALLRWVYMRTISNADCAAVFGAAVVADMVICAEGYTNPENQGHCGGDSGGGLVIQEGGIPTAIGIVSFGAAAGCHLGFPSGYMRTASYLEWIDGHTGIEPRP